MREGITEKQLREAVARWREGQDIERMPPATRRRNKVIHAKMVEIERRIQREQRSEAAGLSEQSAPFYFAHDDRVFLRDLVLQYKLVTTLLVALDILHPEDWETVYQFADDFIKTIGIEIIEDERVEDCRDCLNNEEVTEPCPKHRRIIHES